MNKTESLNAKDWGDLENLYSKIKNHEGAFSEVISRKNDDGSTQMPFNKESEILDEFRKMFSEKGLIIDFDWVNWQEGRDIFASQAENKFSDINAETVLKLFSAIIRSDRFNDGVLANFFSTGNGERLLARLLEFRPK